MESNINPAANAASSHDSEIKTEEQVVSHSGDTPARRVPHLPHGVGAATPTVQVNMRTLVEAGAHFGHQTSRWCPAMAPYIYSTRNGIHIINLPKTVECWKKARKSIVEVASKGGSVLFVGTKKQAQEAVATEAKRCGAFYVSHRWLGGMLTNFQTIRKSVDRMRRFEDTLAEEEKSIAQGKSPRYTKKERLIMTREIEKLNKSLGGIRDLHGTPGLVFVIDIKREHIAVSEAMKLDVPVIALVDTNCDPKQVTLPIPANDDGTRAIKLFCQAVADAVIEGRTTHSLRNISFSEPDAPHVQRHEHSRVATEHAAQAEQ